MTQAARQEITAPQSADAAAPALAPTNLMEAVGRWVTDPNVDADKLERMLAVYERLSAQQAKVEFNQALRAAQKLMPVIDERGGIKNNSGEVQSTYAKWEDINDVVKPILHAHGLYLNFHPGLAPDGKQTVTAILRHDNGLQEEATVTLPHDPSGNKNSVQAVGSSLSYGKRYAAIAILNITSRAKEDRDDDGHGAGLSPEAQKAITDINMADTAVELGLWKKEKAEAVRQAVSQREFNEIVALWNRRAKAFREAAAKAGGAQ